jgi:hypothetical protein
MPRLTKAQKARLATERQEFRRVAAKAQDHGYTLHQVIGLQPYALHEQGPNAFGVGLPVVEGTLNHIENWLLAQAIGGSDAGTPDDDEAPF